MPKVSRCMNVHGKIHILCLLCQCLEFTSKTFHLAGSHKDLCSFLCDFTLSRVPNLHGVSCLEGKIKNDPKTQSYRLFPPTFLYYNVLLVRVRMSFFRVFLSQKGQKAKNCLSSQCAETQRSLLFSV